MKIVMELADALYDCFNDDEKVDTYTDATIARIMKKKLGKKDFEEYDQLNEKEWREAWGFFVSMKIGKLKR